MAGVYTDNQPDFSRLLPYETKTFSQFWWPIQQTGPVQEANERAALRLLVDKERRLDLGVLVSAPVTGARIVLTENGRVILDERRDLNPGAPYRRADLRLTGDRADALGLSLLDADDRVMIRYQPVETTSAARSRSVATTHLAHVLAFSNSDLRAADLVRELGLTVAPLLPSSLKSD